MSARPLVLLLVLAVVLAGCVSREPPQKRRYVLDVTRVEHGLDPGPSAGGLRVDRVRVSPLYERKGFVYRSGDERIEEDFYNEFFASPGVMVRKAVITWMEASPLFSPVLERDDAGQARWALEGRVGALYGDLTDRSSPSAVMEVEFTLLTVRPDRYRAVFQKRYGADVPVDRSAAPAFVEGWRRGLSQILTELENDLRSRVLAGGSER